MTAGDITGATAKMTEGTTHLNRVTAALNAVGASL